MIIFNIIIIYIREEEAGTSESLDRSNVCAWLCLFLHPYDCENDVVSIITEM